MLAFLAEHANELTTQYGNVSNADHRHDPAPASGAGEPGRRQSSSASRRCDSRISCRPTATAAAHQYPRRRQADGEPAALRHVPAVAAVRAVREAARGRRPGQAEARVLLRRGAPAVQRRAEGAAGQDRAGGAADPLQGRRRLFRHAEPARRAGQGAGAARQPRAARAARVHAARPEGGEGRRRDVPANPKLDTARPSPSSARARRWSRSSKATARRRWSSAAWSARRRRASGRSRRRSARP